MDLGTGAILVGGHGVFTIKFVGDQKILNSQDLWDPAQHLPYSDLSLLAAK